MNTSEEQESETEKAVEEFIREAHEAASLLMDKEGMGPQDAFKRLLAAAVMLMPQVCRDDDDLFEQEGIEAMRRTRKLAQETQGYFWGPVMPFSLNNN